MFKAIHTFFWKIKMILMELFRRKKYKNNLKSVLLYKDRYHGKRCFVIGTGPSLKSDDLTLLNDEYTFASNSIFRYFDQTNWRPTFYSVCDRTYFRANFDKCLSVNPKKARLFPLDFIDDFDIFDNSLYYSRVAITWKRRSFKTNPLRGMAEGSTVTYFLLQLAAYMGFSEVYLLGIDFNYSTSINNQGKIIEQKEVRDYAFDDKASNYTMPNLDAGFISYSAAQKYCEKHSEFRIYNATRGGKLEVFPRVNFDDIIRKKRR